ncbi:hypothetical protein CLU88_2932 [Acidovorax sp. 56]|nr:hypothetical protein CLU88_2932 [Acidovorax sp. 56]
MQNARYAGVLHYWAKINKFQNKIESPVVGACFSLKGVICLELGL